MVLSANRSSGYRDDSFREQDRKLRWTAHPSDQFDRAQGSVETTANKQGNASFLTQEQWRTSRRASPTVTLSHSASAPLEVTPRILESTIEGADGLCTHQVPPKGVSSLPRKSDLSSASAGLGRSSETSKVAAVRQLEREDLSTTRAKAPKMRSTQRKNSIFPLHHQGESAEDERHTTQELDQRSDDPLPPNSDPATRQRDRCCFPRRGSIPRPIANRL
jgi:hypothetical protein